MNRFITPIVFLFVGIAVRGQDISRHEADSLLRSSSTGSADTAHINSLLKLAIFEIHKPGEFKADLDSAAVFIDQANQINATLKSVEAYGYITLVESYLHREKGQQKEAKASAEKAIQILNKGTDKFELGQAYMELADYYDYQDPDQLPKKMQLVEQAVNSFTLSCNTERMAYSLRMLGAYYLQAADSKKPEHYYNILDTALEKLNLSLSLYQSIHYVYLQGVYLSLGEDYYAQSDYAKAVQYELMALKTAESVHDTTMQLCEINNHIGITLIPLDEYEKAVNYFKNAMQTAEKYKDYETIYVLASNAADAYLRAKKLLDARAILESTSKKYTRPKNDTALYSRIACMYLNVYTPLKQYHLAKPNCDQLLGFINSNKIPQTDLYNVYLALIKYYLAIDQYSSARIYLNKNDSLTHTLGEPRRIGVNNYLWFSFDTVRHHYQSAISHLLIYNTMRDSVFTEAKSRQAQQLQVQFQTEKQVDQIRLLNETAKLEQANLSQANLVKDVTIGGIILMLIIAGLFFRQFREKQRANVVITQKNEALQQLVTDKEWLLKEVHHRVKNNLHTVISLLESQAHYLKNDALKAIEKSQHRIYAMSLIHQKIYQSDDIQTIEMGNYLPEFIGYLREGFGRPGHIHFQLDIEPLKLGLSQAIPLALIINEAVTNSIKYAFPRNRPGEIRIELHQVAEQVMLSVTDNGIGIDPALKSAELNSLGIKLMKGLTREIKGEISFHTDKGTQIVIVFDLNPLNRSPLATPLHQPIAT